MVLMQIFKGNKRTANIKANVLVSIILKGISILITLQLVPLTLNYVNPTRYGIWLTLSSIIAWMQYFDFGLTHGFRNHFTAAITKGEIKLAKQYVSTTYFILIIIFSFIVCIFCFINQYLDWGSLLHLNEEYSEEIKHVMAILACFMGAEIVAKTFTTLLTADQKPALSSAIITLSQILSFITIFFLVKNTKGNLEKLAFVFTGIPCVTIIIISIIGFCSKKYKFVSPSVKYIKVSLIKNILGLGGKFFGIMLALVFVIQMTNIIVTRVLGPDSVTIYNISNRYIGMLNMLAVIVLMPIWSAFTEAYTQKDYVWMRNIVLKLERLWGLSFIAMIGMVIVSKWFYHIWIGNSVNIPLKLNITMAFLVLSQIAGNIYMYPINGTGKIKLQLIVYWFFAVVTIPLMIWGCRTFGIVVVPLIPGCAYFAQAVIGKIQITKILNQKATGIWNR